MATFSSDTLYRGSTLFSISMKSQTRQQLWFNTLTLEGHSKRTVSEIYRVRQKNLPDFLQIFQNYSKSRLCQKLKLWMGFNLSINSCLLFWFGRQSLLPFVYLADASRYSQTSNNQPITELGLRMKFALSVNSKTEMMRKMNCCSSLEYCKWLSSFHTLESGLRIILKNL